MNETERPLGDDGANVVDTVTAADGSDITVTPTVLAVHRELRLTVTGEWLDPVGPSRRLRTPLATLTTPGAWALWLVVDGDNDVRLNDVYLTAR